MTHTVQNISAPAFVQGAPELPKNLRPAMVGGAQVWIECPDGCVVDHVRSGEAILEDVSHRTAPAGLYLAQAQHGAPLVSVVVVQDPFDRDDPGVRVLIDDTDGDSVPVTPDQAFDFADNLIAFAVAVKAQARKARSW